MLRIVSTAKSGDIFVNALSTPIRVKIDGVLGVPFPGAVVHPSMKVPKLGYESVLIALVLERFVLNIQDSITLIIETMIKNRDIWWCFIVFLAPSRLFLSFLGALNIGHVFF